MSDTANLNMIYALAVSLALGLVIGVEREWRERAYEGAVRPAGVRTFGLISLSGGITGVLNEQFPGVLAAGLAVVIFVMTVAYWRRSHDDKFMGVTTIFAGFAAYGCGGLAAAGFFVPATAAAVSVAVILGAKERLHRFVSLLDQKEIFAALQFLLIAAVIWPLAPNRNFGPYDAVNPFEIWLMVVLISGLSFAGYISVRVFRASRGILGAAILGGFVSSTAVTLSFARMSRRQPEYESAFAAAVVIAATIMMARVAIITAIIWPPLLPYIGVPVGAMMITGVLLSTLRVKQQSKEMAETPSVTNPLELAPALFFAGLLSIIMLASRWLEAVFGPEGVYAVAFASGLADVDALTLSISRFARGGLDLHVAAIAIITAAITNTLVKIGLTAIAGSPTMTRQVSRALIIIVAVGATVAAIPLTGN